MSLFRSELLPFHPPRYRSRVGDGLSRYGRARAAVDIACQLPVSDVHVHPRAASTDVNDTHPHPLSPLAVDADVSMAA